MPPYMPVKRSKAVCPACFMNAAGHTVPFAVPENQKIPVNLF
jgi:hypothetical protein